MRISCNSPVVLAFVAIASLELLADFITHGAIRPLFSSHGNASLMSMLIMPGSFLHIFGHANFDHLVGNMMFLLLLGPILEEKYGSMTFMIMIGITAVSTAVLNAVFFSNGILGASGVVFMLIVLSSFTNVKEGTIPLTFVIVIVLYFGKEFLESFTSDNISHFAHILGGCFGGIFGLIFSGNTKETILRKYS